MYFALYFVFFLFFFSILFYRQAKKAANKKLTTSSTETSGPNNLKAKRGGLDISRSFSSTRTAFPRNESATKTKKAINKVAPIPAASAADSSTALLTKLPPNMVTLVEGFLKEFQNEGHNNINNFDNNKGQQNFANVDMTTGN